MAELFPSLLDVVVLVQLISCNLWTTLLSFPVHFHSLRDLLHGEEVPHWLDDVRHYVEVSCLEGCGQMIYLRLNEPMHGIDCWEIYSNFITLLLLLECLF